MVSQRRGCFHQNGSVSATTAPPLVLRERPDPMARLTNIFRAYPSCLRLHRQLTMSLAEGDGERAADLAALLADTIKRVGNQEEERGQEAGDPSPPLTAPHPSEGRKESLVQDNVPAVGPENVEFALEKTRHSLLARHAENVADAFIECENATAPVTGSDPKASVALPFWKQPSALRVTLLEASFELTLPDGLDADSPLSQESTEAEKHEEKQMALLDEYLTREKKRWETQKGAIGRVVLTTAQRLGLTPEDLHGALEEKGGTTRDTTGQDGRLRLLKHCNLVVRGEVPEVALFDKRAAGDVRAAAEEELEALARRMEQRGLPLTPKDREMALFELVMTKSKMRYVFGLHRELQIALNASEALQRLAAQEKVSSGSEVFFQRVVEGLNKVAPDGTEKSAEDVELVDVLSTPVLPFTFMLKMCLWFDIPQNPSDRV